MKKFCFICKKITEQSIITHIKTFTINNKPVSITVNSDRCSVCYCINNNISDEGNFLNLAREEYERLYGN